MTEVEQEETTMECVERSAWIESLETELRHVSTLLTE